MSYISDNSIQYINKVYSGWMGKMIGVRHGANIEGWTYEQIKNVYGKIDGYIADYKNFAADDDINGPVFFQRALDDFICSDEISCVDMGKTWLNYIPYPELTHGFLWFGGYGISTEQTALENMINGIMPPQSGSKELNGTAVAEQIGGQIFSDCWGFIAPDNPALAANLSEKMASVSHDGNAVFGGIFVAAAVSLAFRLKSIVEIIQESLLMIPADCEYRLMSEDVISFYKMDNNKNWENCFHYIQEKYGYDKYPGVCHVIPNAAVVVMSLLYSGGDFSKGINIAIMAGWDTDCNAGNAGAVLGVLVGMDGIDRKWTEPINDFVCNSSVIGSLNIMDLPWIATYTSRLGFNMAGIALPEEWKWVFERKMINCHFEYPRSTHTIHSDSEENTNILLSNSDQKAYRGKRSLKISVDSFGAGKSCTLYLKTHYSSKDFSDNRYNPAFSPVFYPGGLFSAHFYVEKDQIREKESLNIKPWVQSSTGQIQYGECCKIVPDSWNCISMTASSEFSCIEKIGFEVLSSAGYFTGIEGYNWPVTFFMDEFIFSDEADLTVDSSTVSLDYWTPLHKTISQFTKNRGNWTIEDSLIMGSYTSKEHYASLITGNYYWNDYSFNAGIIPLSGGSHGITFRMRGAMMGYLFCLDNTDGEKAILLKNDFGFTSLKEVPFPWESGNEYKLGVILNGNVIKVLINDRELFSYKDLENPWLSGCIGFSVARGRIGINTYSIKTVPPTH